MEIERKFLLSSLPYELEKCDCFYLEQAYINVLPVIRVRCKSKVSDIANKKLDNPKYILTIKSSGMLSRQEYEMELAKEEYDTLLAKAEGNIISKYRYIIPLENKLKIELDVFEGKFKGLVMGEIEFPDEETAKKYNLPDYVSKEVTFDKRFHNSNMSRMSDSEISDLLASVN